MRHYIGLCVVLGGCGFRASAAPDSGAQVGGDAADDARSGNDAGSDGGAVDAAVAPGCLQHWLDGSPTVATPDELTQLATSGSEERDPWLSQDGQRLYYAHSPGTQGQSDIYLAIRTPTNPTFGGAKDLVNLNTASQESRAALTMDEKTLVLASDRPVGDHFVVVIVTRSNATDEFPSPTSQASVASVNAMGNNHFDPFLSSDGQRLYLAPDIGPGGKQQIVVATRAGTGDFGTPAQVGGVNRADTNTSDPALSLDERILVYSAFKNGQDIDLWYATRPSATGSFTAAAKIPIVNTTADEGDPMISADGCDLYFTSNRDPDGKYHVFHAAIAK